MLSGIYGKDEGDAIARRLFEDKFLISPSELVSRGDNAFKEAETLDNCLQRLSSHEPLQYITGFEWFYGLKVGVSRDVLIPRPETEELVDWVKQDLDRDRIYTFADICTGSGCIALALKSIFPGSKIFATDISEAALNLTAQNEKNIFTSQSIQFIRHDILHEAWSMETPQIIVCNPPYIDIKESADMHSNVLDFEPRLALFVEDPDVLVFYKRVINLFLPSHDVQIYFELNPLTAEELRDFCVLKGLQSEFRLDMQGKMRFARIYS